MREREMLKHKHRSDGSYPNKLPVDLKAVVVQGACFCWVFFLAPHTSVQGSGLHNVIYLHSLTFCFFQHQCVFILPYYSIEKQKTFLVLTYDIVLQPHPVLS